jgi:hypothetical protein
VHGGLNGADQDPPAVVPVMKTFMDGLQLALTVPRFGLAGHGRCSPTLLDPRLCSLQIKGEPGYPLPQVAGVRADWTDKPAILGTEITRSRLRLVKGRRECGSQAGSA